MSVHFNHFYWRDLAILIYIYLDVNECLLTSSMPQQRFNLQISLNYANIEEDVLSDSRSSKPELQD